MKTVLLQALEKAVNKLLVLDPATQTTLQAMSGTVVAFDVTDFEQTIFFLLQGDGVAIQGIYAGEVDARIQGKSSVLFKMAFAKEASMQSGIRFEGDIHVAQVLQSAMVQLDIDWEEGLSRVFGDTIAARIGQGARSACKQATYLKGVCRDNLSEFLHDELRLVPGADELASFYDQVRLLQEDVDRLAARLLI